MRFGRSLAIRFAYSSFRERTWNGQFTKRTLGISFGKKLKFYICDIRRFPWSTEVIESTTVERPEGGCTPSFSQRSPSDETPWG